MLRLLFLVSVLLSFLASRTSAHPRPAAAADSLGNTVISDTARVRQPIGFTTSVQSLENDHERAIAASSPSLTPRAPLGFHEYLEIGNGWNMYYSTWPAMALPVRKSMLEMPYHCDRSSSNETPVPASSSCTIVVHSIP